MGFRSREELLAWVARLDVPEERRQIVAAELEDHLDELVAQEARRGLNDSEAEAAALVRLGNARELTRRFEAVDGAYGLTLRQAWIEGLRVSLVVGAASLLVAFITAGINPLYHLARILGYVGGPYTEGMTITDLELQRLVWLQDTWETTRPYLHTAFLFASLASCRPLRLTRRLLACKDENIVGNFWVAAFIGWWSPVFCTPVAGYLARVTYGAWGEWEYQFILTQWAACAVWATLMIAITTWKLGTKIIIKLREEPCLDGTDYPTER
jgi:hypothetical protein